MLRRVLLAFVGCALLACNKSGGNPFNTTSPARPPAPDHAIIFVSGSWSEDVNAPREVMAIAADGSNPQQLTTCSRAEQPCDMLQVAPSPERDRIVAVRTTPGAEAGAQVLYFMDLGRSVETILFPQRRVDSVDWSRDGSFLLFTSPAGQAGNEDIFSSQPNGSEEQNLTQSIDVRERHARLDPLGRTAVFERIDATGVSRVYIYRETPVTSGAATGPQLPGTPYRVGADADPSFAFDATAIVFRRLTAADNGGLGSWDLMTSNGSVDVPPVTIVSGPLYRGAPDWGPDGILFVETDAAAGTSQLVRVQPDGSGRTVLRTERASAKMGSPRWID